jgi:phosphonate transport system ATP-binding protein
LRYSSHKSALPGLVVLALRTAAGNRFIIFSPTANTFFTRSPFKYRFGGRVMIQVEGLSVVYPGGVSALRSVTLHVRKGEFTVVLGRSGAGKSTLLRCLNYLTRPTSGMVAVDGLGSLDSAARLREHRRRTGVIYQLHQLLPRLTALRNVLVGRLGHSSTWRSLLPFSRADQELALRCLERVGLLDKALRRVDELSGGERQRVGIARALAQQPRLILADEPVASLDPNTADSMLALLHAICKRDGLTAVVSLHQVALARRYAERIVGIAAGSVVFDGPPTDLTAADLDTIYAPPSAAAVCRNGRPVEESRSLPDEARWSV